MVDRLDTLFQDQPDGSSPERRNPSGEAMVNIALTLMRKVDERMERMEDKLDTLSKERREEAREQGASESRLKSLEEFKLEHTDDHKWLWRSIVAAVLSAAAALIVSLRK